MPPPDVGADSKPDDMSWIKFKEPTPPPTPEPVKKVKTVLAVAEPEPVEKDDEEWISEARVEVKKSTCLGQPSGLPSQGSRTSEYVYPGMCI